MTDTTTELIQAAGRPRSVGSCTTATVGRRGAEVLQPELDSLVRKLVLELARSGVALHRTEEGGRQTVLDVQVGEFRCVLTQLPASEHRCGPAQRLSPREAEIVRLVGAGHTNKTIATVLDISLYTVSTHLRRIFAKLGVSTRAAMIAAVSGDLGYQA